LELRDKKGTFNINLELTMRKIICFSIICSGLLACDSLPKGVGEHDRDQLKLSESPALTHIQAALTDASDMSVADLFDPKKTLFSKAPDPTEHLKSHQAANSERTASSDALTVLSYNIALLDAKLFGFIDYSASPHLTERRDELPRLILEKNHDILMLQEAWVDEDVERFKVAADDAGYFLHTGPRDEYNDGCVTLIKKSIMKNEQVLTSGGVDYAERDGLEYWPGPGIKRGFIFLSFEHTSLGVIHVYNTHMMPWWYNWAVRMAEARQVSLHVLEQANDEDVVFLGGDMNAGAYYKDDVWTTAEGEENDGWWANTVSYTFFNHYGDFLDLIMMGRADADVTLDITEGDQVVNNAETSLEIPGGADDWCDTHSGINFTASDCNDLYFMQYAGSEFPARMDHLFVRDINKRVFVTKSEIIFNERVTFGDLDPMQPSDHLGVSAEVTISP